MKSPKILVVENTPQRNPKVEAIRQYASDVMGVKRIITISLKNLQSFFDKHDEKNNLEEILVIGSNAFLLRWFQFFNNKSETLINLHDRCKEIENNTYLTRIEPSEMRKIAIAKTMFYSDYEDIYPSIYNPKTKYVLTNYPLYTCRYYSTNYTLDIWADKESIVNMNVDFFKKNKIATIHVDGLNERVEKVKEFTRFQGIENVFIRFVGAKILNEQNKEEDRFFIQQAMHPIFAPWWGNIDNYGLYYFEIFGELLSLFLKERKKKDVSYSQVEDKKPNPPAELR